jgi:hypothetical protein
MSEQDYKALLKANSQIKPVKEFGIGYNDGYAGNCPNPELENNDEYMSGYDSGYSDRIDRFRY